MVGVAVHLVSTGRLRCTRQSVNPSSANSFRKQVVSSEGLLLEERRKTHCKGHCAVADHTTISSGIYLRASLISSEIAGNLIGSIGICAVSCFFEEMIAHMLQRKLPEGTTLTELPRTSRTSEAPERFRITLATGGEAPWKIKYHADKFDEV